MKISSDIKPILKTLKLKLDELHYDQIQMSCRGAQYFSDPWPPFKDFERKIQRIPIIYRWIYELLLLGKALPFEVVEKIFSKDLLMKLIDIGLLQIKSELIHMDGLSIVSYLGYYFIAKIPLIESIKYKDAAIYLGKDSYYLAQKLVIPPDSYVLDLCTGTGIQAILSSARARKVVGIELEDQAFTIATYNAILNNVENKVNVKKGDLYNPVKEERFDIICSNPPYMPIPSEVKYDVFGDGGFDGLNILRKILNELDNHLVVGGKGIISGWGIGDENYPFIYKILEEYCKEMRWNATLMLTLKKHLAYEAYEIAFTASRYNDTRINELVTKWKKHYQDLEAEYGYDFIIFINKNKNMRLNIIDLSNPLKLDDKPKIIKHSNFKEHKNYILQNTQEYLISMDKPFSLTSDAFKMLKFCNGNRSIKEIIEIYFTNLNLIKNDLYNIYFDKLLHDALEMFYELEKIGIIKCNNNSIIEKKAKINFYQKIKRNFLFKNIKDKGSP